MTGLFKMLRISLAAFLFMAVSLQSYAQYTDSFTNLSRKRDMIAADGVLLARTQMEELLGDIGGESRYDEWMNGARLYRTGKGLLIGFGTLTGISILVCGCTIVYVMADVVAQGIATALTFGQYLPEGVDRGAELTAAVSCYAALAGIAGLAAGTAVFCTGKSKMNGIIRDYNTLYPPRGNFDLTFGIQRNGVGFALNF